MELEGNVYVSVPIYVGESLIKLDESNDYDKRLLETKKIKSEDFERLKKKNLNDFKSQL